ncbi:MAG: acyl carrier protein [Eubacteriaceae bacterium]|nr:acyl carrier protein [Eubacteriaceae bacterium]
MEKLVLMLAQMHPDVDFYNCASLIDDGIIDSFDIISLVADLNEEFEVSISAGDIVPENFNSAQALWELVSRLQNE